MLFESLAASPVTTLGLMTIGAGLIWLAFRIGVNTERNRGARSALLVVVREQTEASEDYSQAFGEELDLRDWRVRH